MGIFDFLKKQNLLQKEKDPEYWQTGHEDRKLNISPITKLPCKFCVDGRNYNIDCVDDIRRFPVTNVKFTINNQTYRFSEYFEMCSEKYRQNGYVDIADELLFKVINIESFYSYNGFEIDDTLPPKIQAELNSLIPLLNRICYTDDISAFFLDFRLLIAKVEENKALLKKVQSYGYRSSYIIMLNTDFLNSGKQLFIRKCLMRSANSCIKRICAGDCTAFSKWNNQVAEYSSEYNADLERLISTLKQKLLRENLQILSDNCVKALKSDDFNADITWESQIKCLRPELKEELLALIKSQRKQIAEEKQKVIRNRLEESFNTCIHTIKAGNKNAASSWECNVMAHEKEYDAYTYQLVLIWIKRLQEYNKVAGTIQEADNLDGADFEQWCADLLKRQGFCDVEVTKGSGDQGVDIIAVKDGIRYAVQCKCYSSDLGNSPIQEVTAGKQFYQCQIGAVMTNRHFTAGAVELAKANGILLWDRDKLEEMLGFSSL